MKTILFNTTTRFGAFALIVLLLHAAPLAAQVADSSSAKPPKDLSPYRKNNVKINLSSLALNNYSLYVERSLTRKISFSAGYRSMPMSNLGELPAIKKISANYADGDELFYGINSMSASANAYTGEFRFYGGKKPGARGFYLSLYGRYTDMKIDYNYTYTTSGYDPLTGIENESRTYNVPIKSNIKGLGGGLMLGAQWLIAKRVTFDWYIVGGHYGKLSGTGSGLADLSSMSDMDKSYLKDDLESTGTIVGPSAITATVTNQGVNAKATGPFMGLRGAGFSLGLAF